MFVVVSLSCGEASAFCFFWNEEEEEEEKKKNQNKNDEKQTQKERSQKKISELNQLHITHTCEHISSSNEKNIFNLLFEKLKYLFFARVFLFANIPTP